MGTRGTWGYAVGGELKLTYNHSDSFPDDLGVAVLSHAREIAANDALRSQVRDLRLVNEDDVPTPLEMERLSEFARGGHADDWYSLLRGAQGKPAKTLRAGVMVDGGTFYSNSLFCEYGYVIDLDADAFEAYVGWQKSAHTIGRFAGGIGPDGYAPIRLVASWPLSALPTDAELEAAFEHEDVAS